MLTRRHFGFTLAGSPLLAQTPAPQSDIEWRDARDFTVEGLGYNDRKSPYDRLPASSRLALD